MNLLSYIYYYRFTSLELSATSLPNAQTSLPYNDFVTDQLLHGLCNPKDKNRRTLQQSLDTILSLTLTSNSSRFVVIISLTCI